MATSDGTDANIEAIASELTCPSDPAEWARWSKVSPNAADMQRERVREFLAAQARAARLIPSDAIAAMREKELRAVLYDIIGLDHHNHAPESRATLLARAALVKAGK